MIYHTTGVALEKEKQMSEQITPLKYLINNLNENNDFLKEYKSLDEKDKKELQAYAKEEMDAKKETD